jgi:hypothetical protein
MTSLPTTPLFADLRRLLLEMAREHALPDLLRLVADRLAESPRVALARDQADHPRVPDQGPGPIAAVAGVVGHQAEEVNRRRAEGHRDLPTFGEASDTPFGHSAP